MDLKQLKHFVAIVDNGTLLAAAEVIPISQPALSRSLQNLEASLGVTLLERSTRGIQITAAGERLYRRAKLILSESKKAVAEAQAQEPDFTLNIGMAPMFAGQVLPEALRALTAENPDIKMRVTSGLFDDLIKSVSSGEIDIMVSNLPFTDIPDDLHVVPLLDITIEYVVSSDHPLSTRRSLSFKDLSAYPWAVVDEQHANDLYQYIFTSEGETSSPIALKTNSLTLLRSMISQPPFITLLPRHMVEHNIAAGQLSILNIGQDRLKRKGGLVYRKNDIPNPALNKLLETLKRTMGSSLFGRDD